MENKLIKILDPLKKEVIYVFNNYIEASETIDMTLGTIKVMALSKTRRFCKKLNKDIAIRVVSKTKSGAI